MRNISLIKVTFAVITAALVSSIVSAKDAMPKNIADIETPALTNIKFEQLDLDKNNAITLVETEKHKLIHDAFTQIDVNSDATISKDEFDKFTQ
jgi:hypothetical protein